MDVAPMSSAPQALRGGALRAVLRSLRHEDGVDWPSAGAGLRAFELPAAPPWMPHASADPLESPDSAGPPAMRPHELARWLELRR
jgi:hypothetical protein